MSKYHSRFPSVYSKSIYASVQKFGEIIVSSDQGDFSIHKRKDRQAQFMVALPTKNINNMTLTFQKHISTKLTSVPGCSLLPVDRMVFSCDRQNKIRVLKSDGSKNFEKKNDGQTLDVVFIGGDSIAVTYRYSLHLKINIIDLKKHKLNKSININAYFVGVVYKDGHLIYCDGTKGITMINLNDEFITSIGVLPYLQIWRTLQHSVTD
ncbi:unnamed protein product [Mytilus edulis]|uniref:Uncharacterized protein n=1 Tax=Mytilus edulis TaxID=6550 RepID=A0A8S3RLC3_MYTED|nr:unnamed protein product [Mytilus edulis]